MTCEQDDGQHLQYIEAFVQAIYTTEALSLPALCEYEGGLHVNLGEVLHLVRAASAGRLGRKREMTSDSILCYP